MSIAVLFAGQGAPARVVRAAVGDVCPELAVLAGEVVGCDPFARLEQGTRYVQPAVFCASVSRWLGLSPPGASFLAGHSLGELSALAAADALSVEDGLRLAALRGRLTEQAAQAEAAGGLLVVEGASPEVVGELGEAHGLVVAADNAPSQAVLSGGHDRLREAAWRARAAGLTTRPVNVCGAFHSPQLRLAADRFRVVLEQVQFRAPRVPVICSLTGRPIDDLPKRLAQGLTEPVLWRQTLLALHRWGARRFIDIGPGRVLLGLACRTLPRDVELTAADSTASARTR